MIKIVKKVKINLKMSIINFIYGISLDSESNKFLDLIYKLTDHQEAYQKYLIDIKDDRENNIHSKTFRYASFKDFCNSDYFDPYTQLHNISQKMTNDTKLPWTISFTSGNSGKKYYIFGIRIDLQLNQVEQELNFGSLQNLVHKIPNNFQQSVLELQHEWNWPDSPKIYINIHSFY